MSVLPDPLWRAVDAALDALAVDRAAPVVVACSGGPDSMALGHAALALARGGRLGPVTLCHVDHQLRPGSAADAAPVARLAAEGGGACVPVAVDVDRRAGSLEAAARDARYAVLHRVAAACGAVAILVAHTRRDQLETVVMRMLRGTGIAGLAGIPPRRGLVVRPLLGVDRADVDAYVARHALATVDDPMNRDERHLRARVRHRVLPLLRAELPQLDDALLRVAAVAADARALLDAAADALTAAARRPDGSWDVAPLAAATPAVLAHTLTRAIAAAGGRPVSAAHHAALLTLVHRPPGGSARADLPGLTAWREYDRLRFRATAAPGQAASDLVPAGPDGPYQVRPWRPGDRMRPVRLRGRSRKLSDLFTDARVPRATRSTARVVERAADGAIVWAEHIGPAFGAKIHVTLTHPEPMATNKSR